jgi:hypothetical protein
MKMKKSHNKKRNVGIIYEQLVLKLSQALVENDKKTFSDTKQIIKKFFAKKTELYREHRLLNSIAVTNITNAAVIPAILTETKRASYRINERKLEYEKSKLIRKINETFGKSFYSTRVPNYTDLASIQTLINEYREAGDADPVILAEYSSKITDILLREKRSKNLDDLKNTEVNSLVVKIMNEKFNKSYSRTLSNSQRRILNDWIISEGMPNSGLVNELKTVRVQALNEISGYKNKCENNTLSEKIQNVEKNVLSTEFPEILKEEHIIKAMTMIQIISELSGEDSE